MRSFKPDGCNPNTNRLFWLCAAWAVAQLSMFFLEQLTGLCRVPYAMTLIYGAILGAYTGFNEFGKWVNQSSPKKRFGEAFVYLWGLAVLAMYVVQFATAGRLKVPEGAPDAFVAVLAIFTGSLISGELRERRRNGAKNGSERQPDKDDKTA